MAPYFASTAGQTESYVMFITRPGQLDIQNTHDRFQMGYVASKA
jgi:hypothetical protein